MKPNSSCESGVLLCLSKGENMLGNNPAMPNIAVKDLSVAKKFYEEILGLVVIREDPSGRTMYKTGNTAIFIYESEFAGSNKADYVAWEVGDDFNDIVTDLQSKDVTFKDYSDMFGVEYINNAHVMGDMGLAWIEDPDGNLIIIAGKL
jgi:catechol 2,3-dioxygenase-like lactoylglutathione lyase family enzyme